VVADGSLIVAENQWEFTNSAGDTFLFGHGTDLTVIDGTGIVDIPDRTAQEIQADDRDGGYASGEDFLGLRRVTLNLAFGYSEIAGADNQTQSQLTETALAYLGAYLARGRGDGTLAVRREGRMEPRLLTCRPKRSAWPNNFELSQLGQVKGVVEFLATDPLWYSYTEHQVNVTLAQAPVGRSYPRSYPLTYATTGTLGNGFALNGGLMATYPIIRVFGPVTNPVIRNVQQDRIISLAMTINAGDYVELDFFSHAVLLNGTASRRGLLSTQSKWFTLEPGTTELTFNAATSDPAAHLEIHWRDAYATA
jgi:hypothetical protein